VQGEPLAEGVVAEAQLESRHWRGHSTDEKGNAVQSLVVDGEAVVGSFPLLKPGAKCNYTSCCHGKFGDTMDGWFTFVPGSLREPRGERFAVKCPRMTWEYTGFVY
jgi:uncharacterized protein affecting Mg2+/Co2+ transport